MGEALQLAKEPKITRLQFSSRLCLQVNTQQRHGFHKAPLVRVFAVGAGHRRLLFCASGGGDGSMPACFSFDPLSIP